LLAWLAGSPWGPLRCLAALCSASLCFDLLCSAVLCFALLACAWPSCGPLACRPLLAWLAGPPFGGAFACFALPCLPCLLASLRGLRLGRAVPSSCLLVRRFAVGPADRRRGGRSRALPRWRPRPCPPPRRRRRRARPPWLLAACLPCLSPAAAGGILPGALSFSLGPRGGCHRPPGVLACVWAYFSAFSAAPAGPLGAGRAPASACGPGPVVGGFRAGVSGRSARRSVVAPWVAVRLRPVRRPRPALRRRRPSPSSDSTP